MTSVPTDDDHGPLGALRPAEGDSLMADRMEHISAQENSTSSDSESTSVPARRTRRRAGAPAGAPATSAPAQTPADAAPRTSVPEQSAPVVEETPKRTTRRRRAGAPAGPPTFVPPTAPASSDDAPKEPEQRSDDAPADAADDQGAARDASPVADDLRALAFRTGQEGREDEQPDEAERARREQAQVDLTSLLFQAPTSTRTRTTVGSESSPAGSADLAFDSGSSATAQRGETGDDSDDADGTSTDETGEDTQDDQNAQGTPGQNSSDDDGSGRSGSSRRRRRRGGRGRRGRGRGDDDRQGTGDSNDASQEVSNASDDQESSGGSNESDAAQSGHHSGDSSSEDSGSSSSSRRRRRRRRSGSSDSDVSSPDDPPNTVVKVREGRDEVKAVKGSTRLEAKKQRRREGRESGRRRSVITEAEFLARRESVKRSMVVRERPGRTQIAVLEDDVLVEHYVAQKTQTSMVGNVYLGKVQNVLPSMEAAFVDIGRGRNAVLYAGEVNWDAAGLDGQPRRIELALKSGDSVLVQVTKDPIGHKGARLTSQISLPGRYVVFVPGGSMTGISRKLPDTERSRLKKIMKQIIPAEAGVIVRTAAEGASEEELTRDVERLRSQWEKIEKAKGSKSAPVALSQEPDLAIRVVRDVFNEDFTSLIVEGERTHDEVHSYVSSVAPDLLERLTRHVGEKDVFAKHRIDEQLLKAMDRKVYLPSGGSLVIDRTEAMTVIDVNTGKFTGSGGSLEETVTRNNLEAAEEIVRQLRLRDIGGIIVIDFIDMVLESNRDLVLRRLVECLGRDRTKHQVAEVTSLGLVQMTRKRVGQGLVETFSTSCEHCNGRGHIVNMDAPAEGSRSGGGSASSQESSRSSRKRGSRGRSRNGSAKDAVSELLDQKNGDVHRLEEDEDSRALARATIASIAAASSQQSHPEVVVDGQVVTVGDSASAPGEDAQPSDRAQPDDPSGSSDHPASDGHSDSEGHAESTDGNAPTGDDAATQGE